MRAFHVIPVAVLLLAQLAAGQPRLSVEKIPSAALGGSRTIRVYLPPSYRDHPNHRYPVLYAHDGQNLFTSAGTNVAFGWGNWELDRTADALSREGKMREIIIVGVDNSPARFAEYGGARRGAAATSRTAFECYATFLIEELKPYVDRHYRTQTDARGTAVLGASLGGLCSVLLAWERPDVFGGAACLSGSFQVNSTNFLREVLRPYNGSPKPARLYLDSGSADFAGGDDGRSLTAAVAAEFQRVGWASNLMVHAETSLLTDAQLARSGLRQDKWAEAKTSHHNEFYWRLRVWRALTFLFGDASG